MSESTDGRPRPAEPTAAAEDTTIRPFGVDIPEEALLASGWLAGP